MFIHGSRYNRHIDAQQQLVKTGYVVVLILSYLPSYSTRIITISASKTSNIIARMVNVDIPPQHFLDPIVGQKSRKRVTISVSQCSYRLQSHCFWHHIMVTHKHHPKWKVSCAFRSVPRFQSLLASALFQTVAAILVWNFETTEEMNNSICNGSITNKLCHDHHQNLSSLLIKVSTTLVTSSWCVQIMSSSLLQGKVAKIKNIFQGIHWIFFTLH